MKKYLETLQHIINNGDRRQDRTGVGTRSIFGMQTRYDLSQGFPAVTTKQLAWRAVVGELLWFIEGSGNERRLAEIVHGNNSADKKTIWSPNADSWYWKPRARYPGDLGRIYGVQWRSWQKYTQLSASEGDSTMVCKVSTVDQLEQLIKDIKQDPYSRRHILTAWNPAELDQMALPPCHILSQFYVSNNRLSCQMYQRSADFFLGVPFNIASYSLLTHMIAQCCDLEVGEFIHTIGDAHVYENHIEAAQEQIARNPLNLPKLILNSAIKNINDFTMFDIKLENYKSHPAIKAPMAV